MAFARRGGHKIEHKFDNRGQRFFDPQPYPLKEAAKALGLSVWVLRERIRGGHIPVVQFVEGGKMYIHAADIERFIEKYKKVFFKYVPALRDGTASNNREGARSLDCWGPGYFMDGIMGRVAEAGPSLNRWLEGRFRTMTHSLGKTEGTKQIIHAWKDWLWII